MQAESSDAAAVAEEDQETPGAPAAAE